MVGERSRGAVARAPSGKGARASAARQHPAGPRAGRAAAVPHALAVDPDALDALAGLDRPANHPPLAASHHAPNVDAAFRGASDKLKHALEHALDKVLKNHRDRDSIRRDLDAAAG